MPAWHCSCCSMKQVHVNDGTANDKTGNNNNEETGSDEDKYKEVAILCCTLALHLVEHNASMQLLCGFSCLVSAAHCIDCVE